MASYFRTHEYVTVDQVAADFHITPRQVRKDVGVLTFCGLIDGMPDELIDFDQDLMDDEGIIHPSNLPINRPMRFSRAEAVSLIVAVKAIHDVSDAATAKAAQSVIEKLSALLGEEAPVQIEVAAGRADVRDGLAEAIDGGRRVRLTYGGLNRREVSAPVVDPDRIEVHDGKSYLVAWALRADAWRTYRVDRISAVDLLDEPVQDHGVPPATVGSVDDVTTTVTLTLDARAAWVAEYYPVREAKPLKDGGVKVVLPVADQGFLTGLLLRLGPAVRAVDPPEAAADALAEARAALGK